MKTKILQRCSNEKGMALVIVLMVVMVFAILGSVFVARTVNEKNTAEREKLFNQAHYVSEAGGDIGLAKLDEFINADLLNTINATNPNVVSNSAVQYVANQNPLGLLTDYVKVGNVTQLTLSGQQAQYSSGVMALGAGTYSYTIAITKKSNPVTITTDMWDFPYYFQINTIATVQNISRKVRLDGDFTVRVQRDNFAKFALFTDHHSLPNATTVWFTAKTDFAGPLHTNERYSFAFNPSGIFDGAVTQNFQTARFYNNGFPILADANSNGVLDVPVFNSSYTRNAPAIVLAANVAQADIAKQASGNTAVVNNGIYVPVVAGKLTGGIYVKGNPTITLAVDANNDAKYTIAMNGFSTRVITVKKATNQTTVKIGANAAVTYTGLPDGIDNLGTILYVDGIVNGLSGTVQQDTQLTLSSNSDINITNHLKYQDYTPAVGTPGDNGYVPPTALNKTNLLGLVSWNGNINVTAAAPNNVEIHAIAMARNGIFQVNNYNQGAPRGVATLLGGVITQYYGAFGMNDANTGALINGYGRNFVYDTRTLLGTAPPYFPSMSTFIAFTNDLTDKVSYQDGGF